MDGGVILGCGGGDLLLDLCDGRVGTCKTTRDLSKICSNGYANPNDNHCAHYVSHILNFRFGTTCRTMHPGNHPGANIRVQELFAHCPQVGPWADRPAHAVQCLVFVTDASGVDVPGKTMANVPRKHVGIYVNGPIWHYSNSRSKVVNVTPELFQHHYHGSGIALFYGTMPIG